MSVKEKTKAAMSYEDLIRLHEERLAVIQEDLAKVPALQAEANQLVGAIQTLHEVIKRESSNGSK